ncbi:MAG: phosphogluconate dehydrogenase C-terminal domain-containing protein [Lapillicoccus sp.]
MTASTDTLTTTPIDTLTIAVIGAGGKMGMRVSNNLVKTDHTVYYVENSPAGRERTTAEGRTLTELADATKDADVVILAVPDIALEPVTRQVVPTLEPGTVVLTLDPAAAYANLLHQREDVHYVVAHPCHPSVFLRRHTDEEYADTFGGIAAPQDVVSAYEGDDETKRAQAEAVIRAMYAPVIDVHWVTVKQLAQCEPTLVETIACMIGEFLKESLHEAVHTMGIPEPAARAILLGHTQVALANALQGDNPFSDACMIAMGYGRDKIIKEDWKVIFEDAELDKNLQAMLHLPQPIQR